MLVIDVRSDVSAIAIEGIEAKLDVCPDATSFIRDGSYKFKDGVKKEEMGTMPEAKEKYQGTTSRDNNYGYIKFKGCWKRSGAFREGTG